MSLPLDIPLPSHRHIETLTLAIAAIEECPVEVLTEIFLYYIGGDAQQIGVLLLVCRRWYLLTMNSPLFWTNVSVSIGTPPPTSRGTPQLRLVKAFIERSKNMLLDIKVDCSRVDFYSLYDSRHWQFYSPALDLLWDSMGRWRTLDVILPTDGSLSLAIFSLLRGSAPNLVTLSVQNFQFRYRQTVCLSELQSLKTLKIDVYPFKKMVHSLPVASLHSLDVDLCGLNRWIMDYGHSNWTKDVSLLQYLRSLQIRITGEASRRTDSSPAPISLPLLQNLGIWNFHDPRIQFEFPSLQTLTFDGLYMPETTPIEVIWRPAFINPHECVREFLRNAIIRYRSAKRFVVPYLTKEELAESLQEMRKEGITVGPQISFMKESQGGKRELIGIYDGVEG